MTYDAIVISDLHLGAKNSESKRIRKFIHKLRKSKSLRTRHLIIAGDLFDKQSDRKLRKADWKIIRQLNKLARKIPVTILIGNHDSDAEYTRERVYGDVQETLVFKSGSQKVFVTHGHQYDEFINEHPLITDIADAIYGFSQMLDPSHNIARFLKKNSKKFIKVIRKIGVSVAQTAESVDCLIAVHGHNHHAGKITLSGVDIWDAGCWTEKPCTFWAIKNGKADIYEYKR